MASLEDIKEMVAVLTGEQRNKIDFKAAVIMLAPFGAESFSIADVAAFTLYPLATVERVVGNLLRYRIWEGNCWRCEWGDLLTGEELSDEQFQLCAISFVCDALVACGQIARQDDMSYSAL